MWNFDSTCPGRSCLGWMSGDEPGDLAAGNFRRLGTVNLAGRTGFLVIIALGGQEQHGDDEWECAPGLPRHPGVLWGVFVGHGFARLCHSVLQIPHTTLFAVKAPLPLVLMDSSSSEGSGLSVVLSIVPFPHCALWLAGT